MKNNKTVTVRISTNKEQVIEKLKQLPIVQVACEKSGISRATYYRWRNDDPKFTKLSDIALREGRLLINDIAESQLLTAIKDQNMTAIIFWLKYNHPSYTTRVEITQPAEDSNKLSSKEQLKITKALHLAGLLKGGDRDESRQERNKKDTK